MTLPGSKKDSLSMGPASGVGAGVHAFCVRFRGFGVEVQGWGVWVECC